MPENGYFLGTFQKYFECSRFSRGVKRKNVKKIQEISMKEMD